MSHYEKSAAKRQAIIDYLIEHPGTFTPDVTRALKFKNTAVCSKKMAEMADKGELRREAYGPVYKYWAMVTTTKPSDLMAAPIPRQAAGWTAKGYVNNIPDREVMVCPDAMHSTHKTVYAGSSCGMMESL